VTMHTSTRISAPKSGASNQIRDLNLLLSNALHTIGPELFAVIRDILLQLLHSVRTTRCTHGHHTLFLLRLMGVASETMTEPQTMQLRFQVWQGASPSHRSMLGSTGRLLSSSGTDGKAR
jgi:hypothetical protein